MNLVHLVPPSPWLIHFARPCVLLVGLMLVASPATLASEPGIDPIEMDTLRDMGSLIICVQAYEIDNDAVPGPTEGLVPAEFLRSWIEPIYIRTMPAEDAWGSPFLYWSDGRRFLLVSHGADGIADREYTGAADFKDGGDDYVVVDGEMAAVPTHLRPTIRAGQQKATMSDMRSLGTCVEAFKIDNGSCPGPTPGMVDVAWMREFVEPVYIRRLPLNDAWGNPFLYWCDGTNYGVASLGLGGEQERPFDEIEPDTATQTFTSDLVFVDGAFTQYPQGEQY